MTDDFRTTVLLDELNAVESQMEPLRLGPRRTVRGLAANVACFGLLALSGLSWRDAALVTTGVLVFAILGYMPSYLKLRALRRERDALFEGSAEFLPRDDDIL